MSSPLTTLAAATDTPSFGALDRSLRTRLLRQMNALRDCQLTVIDALGENVLGVAGRESRRYACAQRCVCTTSRSIAASPRTAASAPAKRTWTAAGNATTWSR